MSNLPTGTVTFLFTDIEGSTALLRRLGDRGYAEVLAEHQRLLRAAFEQGNGREVDTQGDAFLVAFSRAGDAVAAAVAAQLALMKHSWSDGASPRVRMGLHSGEPLSASDRYVGLDVHRTARICAAGHGGQILLSQRTQELVATDLPPAISLRDLGAHRLKDFAEPQRLFQVVAEVLPDEFPPLRSLNAPLNNLPAQLTSFIGRKREKAEIKGSLSNSHLVTLTGIGGAGKTRLALQVAAETLDEFPDGVGLVELAALSDPNLVPQAVASAMDVPERPGRGLTETLIDTLRGKSTLIILDNCEHLVAACAQLTTALLRACPKLRVLATSREALGVTGETARRVPSLSVPDPQHLPPPDRFTEYEAVRLFIDRAAATAPQFAVTDSNAPAVAQICHRLDGIPLAIELAAARVTVLTVEQIAARLDDRFRLLTGGSRTALPRQQTLQAAMDWSYNLLSESERMFLRRLAIFAGGCTLEAAETVCPGGGVETDQVLELLTSLADKSLVLVESHHGEARYRLLETVRQYAWDQLVGAGEAAELQRRHRAWCLDLAERAEARMRGPDQMVWLRRLEVEHDNLRAALGWSTIAESDAEMRLRLAAALAIFWEFHTHWSEGRKWIQTALAGSREIKSTARVKALCWEGTLEWRHGDNEKAVSRLAESLALARELGDHEGIARALIGRGVVIQSQGNVDAAVPLFAESLELFRNLNDKFGIAAALAQMGAAARRKGDYANSVTLCEESLAMFQTQGNKRWIAYSLRLTGHAVRLLGDLKRATRLYKESLALFGETGDKWVATECIEGLALVASAQEHLERAARLFGADEAVRETFGVPTARLERGDYERLSAASRKGLGDAAFDDAWAEGRAMTLEQAIEYALTGDANWPQ